jgi:mannitol-specific phosphotransferase system IIBC component
MLGLSNGVNLFSRRQTKNVIYLISEEEDRKDSFHEMNITHFISQSHEFYLCFTLAKPLASVNRRATGEISL